MLAELHDIGIDDGDGFLDVAFHFGPIVLKVEQPGLGLCRPVMCNLCTRARPAAHVEVAGQNLAIQFR